MKWTTDEVIDLIQENNLTDQIMESLIRENKLKALKAILKSEGWGILEHALASSEGWILTFNTSSGFYEIQKFDDNTEFKYDADAFDYVHKGSKSDSDPWRELYKKAVKMHGTKP